MKPRSRFWVIVPAMFLVAGLAGCTPDQDARNIVSVYSINDNIPLLSDVHNLGEKTTDPSDDFIPSDIVEVTFISRSHDDTGDPTPGEPFGTVTITRYDVIYGAVGGTGADLNGDSVIDLMNFTANMNAVVPTGGATQAAVLVISGAAKSVPPISCLIPGASCSAGTNEFAVNVTIVFHGTEETSDADIEFSTGLLVRIANYADE